MNIECFVCWIPLCALSETKSKHSLVALVVANSLQFPRFHEFHEYSDLVLYTFVMENSPIAWILKRVHKLKHFLYLQLIWYLQKLKN